MDIYNTTLDYKAVCQQIAPDMPDNRTHAISYTTDEYLKNYLNPDIYHTPATIADEILGITREVFSDHNAICQENKWKVPQELSPAQIADIMLHIYHIRNINYIGLNAGQEFDILNIYKEYGENEGIYVSDEYEFIRIIRDFNYMIDTKKIKEVFEILKVRSERVEICSDRDLVAVNNGIFNYKTKILHPFSPDYVFISKCRVKYNPAATNPILHNSKDNSNWDVESWIRDLFPDGSDIPDTIWQIMGAMIRPNVNWGKTCWFVSEKGCNGKGSLCVLMRNLVGEKSCASLSLEDFNDKYRPSDLIGKQANICDENSVGTYIDKAAVLKAIITNDPFVAERKFRHPISIRFSGMLLECLNEMPRVKDRSESFYRRLLFIPFLKSFTEKERSYIKSDYLNRTDVLEYVLYKLLHTNYYKITEPASCRDALNRYKVYNDPVRDFLVEVMEEANWECIPSDILYEMYKGWLKINNPNGSAQGRNTFYNDVRNILDPTVYGWYFTEQGKKQRVLTRMNGPEPLLDKYNCTTYMQNPDSKNIDHRIYPKNIPAIICGLFKCDAGSQQMSVGTDADNAPDQDGAPDMDDHSTDGATP